MLESRTTGSSETEKVLEKGYWSQYQVFLRDPICIKLHSLMERSDFQSDLNWIADQLQENINVIDRAIDGLIALGFIKREDDNLTLAKEDFSLTHFNQSEADKHLEAFKAHRIFSSDILNRFNTDSRFLFHSGFQATDEESVNWFNSELTKLTKEFQRRSKSGDKNMLIGFQMTTTNVCSTKGDV